MKPSDIDNPKTADIVREAVLVAESDLIASNALEMAATVEPEDADAARLSAHALAIMIGATARLAIAAGLTEPGPVIEQFLSAWDGATYKISNSAGGAA
jgi:hypothetical protein